MLRLFDVIRIISIDENDIINAFRLGYKDFEDALQTQCAIKEKVDYIITRNIKDFINSEIEAILVENVLKLID